MLRKLINGEIGIGVAIASLFWIFALIWGTSYVPTGPEKEACYQSAAKSGRSADECKSFWEKTTSDPIAFFTLVLAFSTVGLWVATICFYFSGQKQFGLARDEFIASHRPKVRVRRINLEGDIRDSQTVLTVHLANGGESSAVIRQIGCCATRKDGRRWIGRPDPRAKIGGPNSEPFTLENPLLPMGPTRPFCFAVSIDDDAKAAISEGQHQLFVVGEIEYSEKSGIIRTTGFCWWYDPSTRDFQRSEEDKNTITKIEAMIGHLLGPFSSPDPRKGDFLSSAG